MKIFRIILVVFSFLWIALLFILPIESYNINIRILLILVAPFTILVAANIYVDMAEDRMPPKDQGILMARRLRNW